MISLIKTDSNNEDFKKLIRELDSDLNNRYKKLQFGYDELNNLEFIETIIVAYDDSIAIGCGCFKEYSDDTVEIKRFYLNPGYRGKGIADSILRELEFWASEKGFSFSQLETGIKQPEAQRFYFRNGYHIMPNYPPYIDMPNSICMSKKLI